VCVSIVNGYCVALYILCNWRSMHEVILREGDPGVGVIFKVRKVTC